jgi:dGTPase
MEKVLNKCLRHKKLRGVPMIINLKYDNTYIWRNIMREACSQKNRKPLYEEILKQNRLKEKCSLGKFSTRSWSAQRRRDENIPDRLNVRPAYFHDADRIIHCNAYTRYFDKTQVFSHIQNDHITRRVLHVQMVSKIGRTLARFLQANEDLVEAIALAHDLGHTPYGHTGESILAGLLEERNAGSFVHSAQSVRVLDILENDGKGLNLTLQVLDGVLGHNGEFWKQSLRFNPAKLTWNELEKNTTDCFSSSRASRTEQNIYPSTLEGCLVRVSDVFAYIGRDIEDAIRLNIICREDLPRDAISFLGDTNREIVEHLVMDLMHHGVENNTIRFSARAFESMKSLLEFNYEKIYNSAMLAEGKANLKKQMTSLFDAYLEDLEKGKEESEIYSYFLSKMNDTYRETTTHERIVADFIAGMTNRFFDKQYSTRFVDKTN